MPARAERIHLYSAIPNIPNRIIDFPAWWDRRLFFDQFGERQHETANQFDVNYSYKLTAEEALHFDTVCQKLAYPNPGDIRPLVQNLINDFRSMVVDCKWVIIESYEWESGFD